MGQTFAFSWEIPFMAWLQNTLGEGVISVLSHLSFLGEEYLLFALITFLYFGQDKQYGIAVARTVLLSTVLSAMVKNVFIRRRPYFDNPEIKVYRPVEASADLYDIQAQGFSFPSGHSTNGLAAYGAVARYPFAEGKGSMSDKCRRILVWIAVLIPLLIGFSRVIVGVHYPTDILFGWAFGLGMVFVVPFLHARLGNTEFAVATLLISAAGIFFCHSNDYFSSLGLLIGYNIAIPFEAKFVNFSEAKNPLLIVARIAGAGGFFAGLNALLKLPFSADFLGNGSLAAHLVRTGRYAIVIFIVMGLYPMLFKAVGRVFRKDIKE